jgi:hypothetical protein
MGGEVISVAGPDLTRQAVTAIRELPGVLSVKWAAMDRLDVIVEDAGSMLPTIVDALREANVEVEEVSELRPSFDDVFVQLMDREAEGQPSLSGGDRA